MKLFLMLIACPLFGQILTPSCSYTLLHPPAGTTLVFRNGTLLRESVDYAWTGPRTFGVANFADGDKITAYYTFQRPNKAFLPTAEYTACVGDQNPPPPVVQISRAQCQGSGSNADGTKWNCAGIELWSVKDLFGSIQYYSAVGAAPDQIALPTCPSTDTTKGCWHPVTVVMPPAPGVRAAFFVVQTLN